MNKNKNRGYDKYPDLRERLDALKELDKEERDAIIAGIKDSIMSGDPGLIDRHVMEFPMTSKRRWYDQDPYCWLTVNALKYANEDLIEKVTSFIKCRM